MIYNARSVANPSGAWPSFVVPYFCRVGGDNSAYVQSINVFDEIVDFVPAGDSPGHSFEGVTSKNFWVRGKACHAFSFEKNRTASGSRDEVSAALLPVLNKGDLYERPLVYLAAAEFCEEQQHIEAATMSAFQLMLQASERSARTWQEKSVLTGLGRLTAARTLNFRDKSIYEYPILLGLSLKVIEREVVAYTRSDLLALLRGVDGWERNLKLALEPYLAAFALDGTVKVIGVEAPSDGPDATPEPEPNLSQNRRGWFVFDDRPANRVTPVRGGTKVRTRTTSARLSSWLPVSELASIGDNLDEGENETDVLIILDPNRFSDEIYQAKQLAAPAGVHLAVFFEDLPDNIGNVAECLQRIVAIPAATHTLIKSHPINFHGRITKPTAGRYIQSLLQALSFGQDTWDSIKDTPFLFFSLQRIASAAEIEEAVVLARLAGTMENTHGLLGKDAVVTARSIGRPRLGEELLLSKRLSSFDEISVGQVRFNWTKLRHDPYHASAQVALLRPVYVERHPEADDLEPYVTPILESTGLKHKHVRDIYIDVDLGKSVLRIYTHTGTRPKQNRNPGLVLVSDFLQPAEAAEIWRDWSAINIIPVALSDLTIVLLDQNPSVIARHLSDIKFNPTPLSETISKKFSRAVRVAAASRRKSDPHLMTLPKRGLSVEIQSTRVATNYNVAVTGNVTKRPIAVTIGQATEAVSFAGVLTPDGRAHITRFGFPNSHRSH